MRIARFVALLGALAACGTTGGNRPGPASAAFTTDPGDASEHKAQAERASDFQGSMTIPDAGPVYGSELEGFAYPCPVHQYDFVSQGTPLRMAYMDVQPATPNGRTVVLLHGKNFTAATWQTTIAALTEAGYRVVAPDQEASSPEVRATLGNYPKLGQEAAARIPRVHLVEFPDLGHAPQIQAPERFHKVLLDWLRA